jgi:hypothetical protein
METIKASQDNSQVVIESIINKFLHAALADPDSILIWSEIMVYAREATGYYQDIHDLYRLLNYNLPMSNSPWGQARDIVGKTLASIAGQPMAGTLGDPTFEICA